MILPIILAGGSGTRLWPLSRQLNPKQFLNLHGDFSLLQQTVHRLQGADFYDPWLICNEDQRFLAAEQLRQLDVAGRVILEPVGRNTAPAIAVAALMALQHFEDVTLLVLPADHVIKDTTAFQQAITSAKSLADEGRVITFGIQPTQPETGYGYIRKGQAIQADASLIDAFVEKPDEVSAQAYLHSGEYLWNSGMFMFKASCYLEELGRFEPEMINCCREAVQSAVDQIDFTRVGSEAFARCPADSIDYALMEKTDKAAVVSLDAGWSDVGSWSALWDIAERDASQNAVQGDVVLDSVNGSLIRAEHRLVAAVGVENLIIVETKDAVLVVAKDQVQKVKNIVERIKKDGRHEHMIHREVYRPWGFYDSIDQGYRYQVKRISVNPGAKLSVQMHYHRAEHWVVVSGTAKVTCGDRTYLVTENQSTYIPVGEVHSLENPSKVPLVLIEVQSGAYLGEDDIVRFEDCYGRVENVAVEFGG